MLKKLLLVLMMMSLIIGNAFAEDIHPYHITMVLYRGCEDACKGFKDYFEKRQIPVEFEILDAEADIKKIPGFLKHIRHNKPDLLVTWGTSVTMAMLGTYDKVDPAMNVTDIPALFMIVSSPIGSRLVQNLSGSGRNIAGTLYLVPVTTQLRAAKMYLPFKRIGFLFNPTEDNSKVTRAELEAARAEFGFELITRDIAVDADGKPDKQSLPRLINQLADEHIDMLYMTPDSFLLVNRDLITSTAMARDVPVLATAEPAVLESNALLGVVNRYYTVGQLTATKAEQILVNKVSPADIAIEAPPNFTLIVNMKVAKALKRYPPIRVLKIAEVVQTK